MKDNVRVRRKEERADSQRMEGRMERAKPMNGGGEVSTEKKNKYDTEKRVQNEYDGSKVQPCNLTRVRHKG